MKRSPLLLSAMTLIGALLFGGLLVEGTLRVYAAVDETFGRNFREFDPMAPLIEPHGTRGYRQKPNTVLQYTNGTSASSNALNYRGPEVPIRPDSGTIRILLLGGSTTHGWGVNDDQTIDAHMRTILRERFPNRRFEVVNLGLDGYDTYQLLERMRTDGVRMSPSVVILNTGINDVRNALFPNLKDADPRTLLWENVLARLRREQTEGPTLWTRVKHWSFVARTPGYVRDQMRKRAGLRRRLEPTASPAAGAGGPPYPEAAVLFEKNVREIVKLAQEQGAAVLLSTPPSALSWFRPDTTSQLTYWIKDAATTQSYRDELARRLRVVAADEQAANRPVAYLKPTVAKTQFLDDCHLTDDGNRALATQLVDAVLQLLERPAGGSRQGKASLNE